MTEENLKALIDAVFQFAEGKVSGRPLLTFALKEANSVLDTAGLPALLAFLKTKGLA